MGRETEEFVNKNALKLAEQLGNHRGDEALGFIKELHEGNNYLEQLVEQRAMQMLDQAKKEEGLLDTHVNSAKIIRDKDGTPSAIEFPEDKEVGVISAAKSMIRAAVALNNYLHETGNRATSQDNALNKALKGEEESK